MKYFHSNGGNNSPYFAHRIKVTEFNSEMHDWCIDFDDEDKNFRRWHVERKSRHSSRDYDIVQFEWERAAILFVLKWL